MKNRSLTPLLLASALLASCAAPVFESPWSPQSELHTSEDWSLSLEEAIELAYSIPTASKGEWFGESGTAGEGIGLVYYQGNHFSGTWKDGLLEGPFRGYRRDMLLIEGVAEGGEVTTGTLYEHNYFHSIYSSSWGPERTEFIRAQGGTHALIGFQGDFKDGRPYSGRFYDSERAYRPTSYIEGTRTEGGEWEGAYASYELRSADYDELEFTDDDYKLVEQGTYENGLREGHWSGPGVNEYLVRGLRNGLCKTLVIAQSHSHSTFVSEHAWLSGTFEDGRVDGIMRLTYEGGDIDFAEFQGAGDGSDEFAYGWHLVQPREGIPHMIAVDHSGRPVPDTLRDLPEGTTWNSLMAYTEVLDLGNGVTWYGPVANGEPSGFGRRFGFHDAVLFEEGFFKNGVSDGILMGMTERNDTTGFQLLYAWNGGIELDKESGFRTYTLDDVEEGAAEWAAIQQAVADNAFKYRPESERVWRVLVWEGLVISPEGVEVKPRIVRGPFALRAGDIVWIERTLDGIRRGFMEVELTPTDKHVKFRGYDDTLFFFEDDTISVFSRSETGAAFSGLLTACATCDSTGTTFHTEVRQYKEHASEYNPALQRIVNTTYLVTERTPTPGDCAVCDGHGVILDRYLGH